MDQIELYIIANNLKPGKAINLHHTDIVECVRREQPSLLFSSVPTLKDIDNFIKKISENWEIEMTHNLFENTWTMYKRINHGEIHRNRRLASNGQSTREQNRLIPKNAEEKSNFYFETIG